MPARVAQNPRSRLFLNPLAIEDLLHRALAGGWHHLQNFLYCDMPKAAKAPGNHGARASPRAARGSGHQRNRGLEAEK
jgi:hypothetical protein